MLFLKLQMLLGDPDIGYRIKVTLLLKYVVSTQTLFGSGLAKSGRFLWTW